MPQVLTVSCKLEVLPHQIEKVEAVLLAFANCCEYVNRNTPEKLTNHRAVQCLVYMAAKADSGLPSQLTIHAIRRVCANRKTAKHKGCLVKKFAPTSATYDSRSFSFREEDSTVTLSMLKRRERFRLHIGNYQLGLLKGQNPKSATLVKRIDGTYYLQIQISSEPPQVESVDQVLGIDLGRTDIAVTSSGDKFSGKQLTKVRDKFSRVRASLQRKASKGTRSTRRRARQVLQRLSGRERKFQTNINHTVSYRVVQQAKTSNQAIALEDLTGIRERTNQLPRSKTERRRSNSWAFFQLRMFILYKGVKFGVAVHLVDPRYTSKSCHRCKVLGDRQGKKFSCLNLACGWVGDADLNGANNISDLGALINCPGGSSAMFCSLQDVVLRAAENPILAVGRVG
ncbi:transposase [Rivularia sp. UHCC 0363]|uniref:RNA-guided endonuclease InsQ/TnpB family protein n=1 Tax=Rivularia sp. UHCC 0363 TaxID=3110244 RepID=UPI002B208FA6|nr:transposase [Rivularia sp. UHCC 0363]MEA5598687.1 transposase [Rivularia sp. UHCC 0363]